MVADIKTLREYQFGLKELVIERKTDSSMLYMDDVDECSVDVKWTIVKRKGGYPKITRASKVTEVEARVKGKVGNSEQSLKAFLAGGTVDTLVSPIGRVIGSTFEPRNPSIGNTIPVDLVSIAATTPASIIDGYWYIIALSPTTYKARNIYTREESAVATVSAGGTDTVSIPGATITFAGVLTGLNVDDVAVVETRSEKAQEIQSVIGGLAPVECAAHCLVYWSGQDGVDKERRIYIPRILPEGTEMKNSNDEFVIPEFEAEVISSDEISGLVREISFS